MHTQHLPGVSHQQQVFYAETVTRRDHSQGKERAALGAPKSLSQCPLPSFPRSFLQAPHQPSVTPGLPAGTNTCASAAAVQDRGYQKLQKPPQTKAKPPALRIKERYLVFIKRLQSLHSLLLFLWSTTGEKLIHIHDTALGPALEREIPHSHYPRKDRDSPPTRKENP